MKGIRRYLLLLLIGAAIICPAVHAQIYMKANVQLPTPGSTDEQVVGTCQAVLLPYDSVDGSVTPYEDYFYYGVYTQSCTLYTPNNEQPSCSGTQGYGGGYASSSCATSTASSAEPGNYQLQGAMDIYNWYDNFGTIGGTGGWGECYDLEIPYDDPLDYAYYGGQSYPGVTTTPTYSGIGYVDWNCEDVNGFADILEISTPDYNWGGQMSIKLSPTDSTLNPGANQEFTATVTNGSGATVTWTQSNSTGTISTTSGTTTTYYQIFPTYSVYVNGKLIYTVPQGTPAAFANLPPGEQLSPSDIQ